MLFGQKKNRTNTADGFSAGPDAGTENGTFTEMPGGKKKKKFSPAKLGRNMVLVILALVVVYLLGGSIYTLRENEYAVVTTFGVPSVVGEPGMHVVCRII